MAMSEHINWKRVGEPKKFFTIKSRCMEAPEDIMTYKAYGMYHMR